MICPKCLNTISADSRFCSRCGHALSGEGRSRLRWLPVALAGMLIVTAGASSIVLWYSQNRISFQTVKLEGTSERFVTENDASEFPAMIPFGLLEIEDVTGKLLYQGIAPIVDTGWIALPLKRAFGGYRWRLRVDERRSAPIEGGMFRSGDEVGIWRTALPPPAVGPPLAAYDAESPLEWYALEGGDIRKDKMPRSCSEFGLFVRCDLPDEVTGPGLFLQGGKAVGWTFDAGTDGAFFWSGPPGAELTVELRIEDHYQLTFAGSREEKWLQALAADDRNGLKRLELLLSAYQHPRALSDRQLPPNLNPGHMTAFLRKTVSDLAEDGLAPEVLDRFDRQMLLEIDDPDLVIQIGVLTNQVFGTEAAVNVIESVKAYLDLSGVERSRVDAAHRALYIRLLDELAGRGDWSSAAQWFSAAQSAFPDDPQLNLFEVRLILAEGDWGNAERLLAAIFVPQNLSGMAAELQSEIDRLKTFEGNVVVRFPPGSRIIRVTAELNDGLSQSFLIDTGASLVTIPRTSAQRLGIPLEGSAPMRTVYTAGGPVSAREITIDTITLNGWRIRRVTALVLDIPGRPELGLLGLNYLNRFDIDLQTDKGLLVLTPK